MKTVLILAVCTLSTAFAATITKQKFPKCKDEGYGALNGELRRAIGKQVTKVRDLTYDCDLEYLAFMYLEKPDLYLIEEEEMGWTRLEFEEEGHHVSPHLIAKDAVKSWTQLKTMSDKTSFGCAYAEPQSLSEDEIVDYPALTKFKYVCIFA